MNEQALLGAIAASPHDAALRQVYADWLEERGDARGELVRVEEEMRALPAYSDRFWQLKARRNELRALAAPGWLEAMGYRADAWPLFGHGVPDGWRERWRLVRELVERWRGRPMPDAGGRAAEAREVEEWLGRALPPSLREWVAFAHDLSHGADHLVVLRDLYQMQELAGQTAVSLLLQGEGDCQWAVRYDDFALADPPVYGYGPDFGHDDPDTFVPVDGPPVNDSVSSFALHYALNYTRGAGGGLGAHVPDPTRLLHDFAAAFPIRCRLGEEVLLYEADNIRARLSPSGLQQGVYVEVEVARPLPREAIPACVWDCTRFPGWRRGMFDPGPYAGLLPAPLPGGEGDDAIPF
jgi:uncharacterized protein (TIGR02996 family)